MKYKVKIQYTVWEEAEIEAEDEEAAYDMALGDGGEIDFKETDRGNWEINDIKEIKE